MASHVQVTMVVEGEFDVTIAGSTHRMLVPAGVGIPGVDDETFLAQFAGALAAAGVALQPVVDVAQLVSAQPWLLSQVSDAIDADADTVG